MGRKIESKLISEGDLVSTSFYGDVKVIEYITSRKIRVRFLNTGYESTFPCEQILSGSIKDRLAKTVCGVGFLGEGQYLASYRDKKPYLVWRSMLQRCYMPNDCQGAYKGCSVVDEWHNFQNFAAWFDDNYPHGMKGYELDKDIKINGNKVYGPQSCQFVTKHENLSEKSKSVDLMNGITGEIFHFDSLTDAAKSTGMSIAQVCRLGRERLGKCTSDGWFVINSINGE